MEQIRMDQRGFVFKKLIAQVWVGCAGTTRKGAGPPLLASGRGEKPPEHPSLPPCGHFSSCVSKKRPVSVSVHGPRGGGGVPE